MLPSILRMFSIALMLTTVVCPAEALFAQASDAVRYHFGDDLRWADPAFDDSAWHAAVQFGQDDDITVLTLTRFAPGRVEDVSLNGPVLVRA